MRKSFCRPPLPRHFSDPAAVRLFSWAETDWASLCNNAWHVVVKIGDERRNFYLSWSLEAGWRYLIAMLPSSLSAIGEQKNALIDKLKRLQQGVEKSYVLKCNSVTGLSPLPYEVQGLEESGEYLKGPETDRSSVWTMGAESTCCERTIDEALPDAMLMEIMSRVPDARDLASCAGVNTSFRNSSKSVRSVRFVCRLEDIRPKIGPPFRFRDAVTGTLEQLKCVETLVLEIEDEIMLANKIKTEETKNSLWLTEKSFIRNWLDPVKATLQNLTVIDYGQQAIFRHTNLLQLLADHCKQLGTLELRNMFLDCKDIGKMSKITTLTLRCVKLSPNGLKEINESMPALETLTLVTVVGLKSAEFKSNHLKVLCLGLATKVDFVKLEARNLVKLQLKMSCPENILVIAPELKCLAVCMDKRERSNVEFRHVKLLKELLMGASEFTTLNKLSSSNPSLDKVFLDVPCMAFEDSGTWKGILNVPLDIPNMDALRSCCPNLQTMSVGPGLWYALEVESTKNGIGLTLKWPKLKRLILHLIVRDKRTSMSLLTALVKAIPSLTNLEVYVHTDCRVCEASEFGKLLKIEFPHLDPICDTWKKGLRFECFSF